MYLSKNSKKILKELKKMNTTNSIHSDKLLKNKVISTLDVNELLINLEYLDDLGLIKYKPYVSGDFMVKITKYGLDYENIKRYKRFKFFKHSILTPILVSFITTILTTFVIKYITEGHWL